MAAAKILGKDGSVAGVRCCLWMRPFLTSVSPLETVVVEFTPQRQT